SKLCSKGSIGLRSNELLKNRIDGSGARAATGTIKRNEAPDSPQSMGSFAFLSGAAPVTVQHPSSKIASAPKALIARRVAWVSSDNKGFDILEVPFDRAAAISIRCV